MKTLLILSALLTLSLLSAEEKPETPASFKLGGESYFAATPESLPAGVLNRFTLHPKKRPDGSSTEVLLGIAKAADCKKFATDFAEGQVQRAQPHQMVTYHVNPKSSDMSAAFSFIIVDSELGITTTDIWSLQRNLQSELVIFTAIENIVKDPTAQKKIQAGFPENTIPLLRKFLAVKRPPTFLPSRAFQPEQAAPYPEGLSIHADQAYYEKIFTGEGKAPPHKSPFKLIIPKKFSDTFKIVGNPTSAELFKYRQTDSDGKLIESITFNRLVHSKAKHTSPLVANATLSTETQFTDHEVLKKGGSLLARYATKINGLDAGITIVGIRSAEEAPPVFHQYVTILQPNSTDGIFATLRIDTAKSPDVKTLEDLLAGKGFANETLASFRFAEEDAE